MVALYTSLTYRILTDDFSQPQTRHPHLQPLLLNRSLRHQPPLPKRRPHPQPPAPLRHLKGTTVCLLLAIPYKDCTVGYWTEAAHVQLLFNFFQPFIWRGIPLEQNTV